MMMMMMMLINNFSFDANFHVKLIKFALHSYLLTNKFYEIYKQII